MTVKVKQRIPDKDTLEQHEYIKYDVVHFSTYHDGFGGGFARFINKKNQISTISLYHFDIEIVDC